MGNPRRSISTLNRRNSPFSFSAKAFGSGGDQPPLIYRFAIIIRYIHNIYNYSIMEETGLCLFIYLDIIIRRIYNIYSYSVTTKRSNFLIDML
jgi:hypothetical protein